MICIVPTLGAPVTDADGNSAARISSRGAVVRAVTEEVICQTFEYGSSVNSAGTSTLPNAATRPRSFRTMSTTITFSARSFADRARSSACARSSATVRPRRAVPFIGRARIVWPSYEKNSSGDAEQIACRPTRMNAA